MLFGLCSLCAIRSAALVYCIEKRWAQFGLLDLSVNPPWDPPWGGSRGPWGPKTGVFGPSGASEGPKLGFWAFGGGFRPNSGPTYFLYVDKGCRTDGAPAFGGVYPRDLYLRVNGLT